MQAVQKKTALQPYLLSQHLLMEMLQLQEAQRAVRDC